MKKTLVLGASLKPDRYSNFAIHRLIESEIEAVGVGYSEGFVEEVRIYKGMPSLEGIHTVTVYLNAKNQEPFLNYVLSLNPVRVIFNPGTKNKIFENILTENNIFFENACTLVLLSTGQY